jgi:lysophospholipase L1-like esterase
MVAGPRPEGSTSFTATTVHVLLEGDRCVSSASTGSIVAFGDSITDGTCSTPDAHDRWRTCSQSGWPDSPVVAHRGAMAAATKASAAIPSRAPTAARQSSGTDRLDRDVLTITRHHVVLFMGTNDVRREAAATQVIAGPQRSSAGKI